MPRRGRHTTGMISPNLTPLLDVVLQLITFFMMLVHFGSRLEGASREVRLPVAPAALPGSDLTIDRLPVLLDARGSLRVGGQSLSGDAAAAWWARQASLRRAGLELLPSNPNQVDLAGPGTTDNFTSPRSASPASSLSVGDELPTVVILRADREASYGAVRRTLAQAQQQGFARFSLVVLRREQP